MANFINKYLTAEDYLADDTKQYPNVSLVDGELMIVGQEPQPVPQDPYLAKPFTIKPSSSEPFGDGDTVIIGIPEWSEPAENGNTYFSYSVDAGNTWTTAPVENGTDIVINTPANTAEVQIKGDYKQSWDYGSNAVKFFVTYDGESEGYYNVEGNIMSLMYGDDFVGQTALPESDYGMFFFTSFVSYKDGYNQGSYLVEAHNLRLPATTLTPHCYNGMFQYSWIETAPELPATTLAARCYADMFRSCSHLMKAPSTLPATTLADGCYSYMFDDCSMLQASPWMAAPTFDEGYDYGRNYEGMFASCSRLSSIACMVKDGENTVGLTRWCENVASNGVFIKDPDANWDIGGYGIPEGWIVLDNVFTPVAEGDDATQFEDKIYGFQFPETASTENVDETNPLQIGNLGNNGHCIQIYPQDGVWVYKFPCEEIGADDTKPVEFVNGVATFYFPLLFNDDWTNANGGRIDMPSNVPFNMGLLLPPPVVHNWVDIHTNDDFSCIHVDDLHPCEFVEDRFVAIKFADDADGSQLGDEDSGLKFYKSGDLVLNIWHSSGMWLYQDADRFTHEVQFEYDQDTGKSWATFELIEPSMDDRCQINQHNAPFDFKADFYLG